MIKDERKAILSELDHPPEDSPSSPGKPTRDQRPSVRLRTSR